MKAKEYAQALFEALSETKASDHDKVLDNFARIITERGDAKLLNEIGEEFHKFELESQGIKQVEVTTANDSPLNKELVAELNKIVGTKTEIKHKVDEGIIGGVIVRVDDTLIDASVKHNLNNLKNLISKTS